MQKLEWDKDFIGKVIQGDCLEVMKDIPDKSIDLILTDPPFGKICYRGKNGIGRLKEKNRTYESMAKWGIDFKPKKSDIELIISKCKNYIIWGANYFIEAFPSKNCFLIWDKQGEWKDTCFAGVEMAMTSFNTVARKYICRNQGFVKDSKDGHIEHPTPKPTELFQWCVKNYSKETDIILDPFLGSGTTAIACKRLNRRWIGIEINPEYVKLAEKRIKQEQDQMKLF